MKTDAPKDPNMGGIVGQIAKGGDGLGRYVINCYSRVDRLEAKHNDVGGIAGIVQRRQLRHQLLLDRGKDHSQQLLRIGGGLQQERQPAEHLRQLGMSVQVCGELRRRQRQGGRNGLEKDDFRPALARRDEVGAVTVPSSGESCANFAAALNAGAALFNDTPAETLPGKPDVVLRKWTASESYPVLEK